MSTLPPLQDTTTDHQHHGAPSPVGRPATGHGTISLALSAATLLTAPILLIPILGFLPALLAAAGVLVAWTGLRGSMRGTGITAAGLVVTVIVFAVSAGIATAWHVGVIEPAFRDYEQLHDVIPQVLRRIFGA